MYLKEPLDRSQIANFNPVTLAYIGDAVFELLVRQDMLAEAERPMWELQKSAAARVCAAAQSDAVEKILPYLTEEEEHVWKRGRNSNSSRVPKNADPVQYRRATGLEALFGYLCLCGRDDRIKELFDLINAAE